MCHNTLIFLLLSYVWTSNYSGTFKILMDSGTLKMNSYSKDGDIT